MKNIILFFLILSSLLCKANEENDLFLKANSFYQKNEYDSAIITYKKIISNGNVSSELYFNMGNAYFKTKKISSAILNYEKALKLAPNDEDIAFNLSLANLQVVDKITPVPSLFYKRWFNSIANLLSANSWSSGSIVLIWITFIFAVLFIVSQDGFQKKLFFFSGLFLLILSLTSFSISRRQLDRLNSETEGIVFDASVYVKSSPDEKGVDLFILHEGSKVSVLDEIGEWKKIRIANGSEGWLKIDSIMLI